ncbi:MAG: glycosyltransferase family 4 protein [Gemmatimonadota bacterium]|nr:glycosyltransferase family 4 protein [Gemmatimonadota bacterium]
MTRVLFWCDFFWPLIGGVEVLSSRLVPALRDRGHEIEVVSLQEESLPSEDSYHGVPVHRYPITQAVTGRDVQLWTDIRRDVAALKRRFRPEIVHVYHANFDAIFHLTTAAAHPARTICTLHGTFLDESMTANGTLSRLFHSADWITSCSVAALEVTRRQLPMIASRSSVILNALEPLSVAATPLPFDPPILFGAGRLRTNEKGFDVAIAAMPELLGRFPHLKLIIAGDGWVRADLERQAAEIGVGDSIRFLGWVHPDRVTDLINEATVVLMPSRVPEGFGLVALQAAQLARPVVATRVGGLHEVVVDGETGFLVPNEDSGAMSRAIACLLANPQRAIGMGQAAKRRADQVFRWESHVSAYDDLLHRVAALANAAVLPA